MAKRKKTYKTRRAEVRALRVRVETLQRENERCRVHSRNYHEIKDALDPIPGESVTDKLDALQAVTAFTLRRVRLFVATKAREADVPANHVPAVIMTDVLDYIDREGGRIVGYEHWGRFIDARHTLQITLRRLENSRAVFGGMSAQCNEFWTVGDENAVRALLGEMEPLSQ